MFARMTSGEATMDKLDEFIKTYENSIVPAAKSQKGYCGAYFLVDRKSGKVVSITLWESEEDALANEKSLYYQEQLIKVKDFLRGSLIREGFEVSVRV
ncbi:MAG: hypothetical protein AMJ73_00210 [candidate division Zixibacteria bacterium SM1_73]|nr:MAG: hypothetical protein AMJ73_00210 [candidate division Zixibacteria bacterium SM1_73]